MVNLTRNGFKRREDLDFTDDGNSFYAYEYNGIIVTKCTFRGEYFISVDIHKLNDNYLNFEYDDYSNKDWYTLADEFNGTYEVDVDKLKENIDIIRKGLEELIEDISKETIDNAVIENQLLKEEKEIEDFINENKVVDIMKYNSYQIRRLKDYFEGLQRDLEIVRNMLSVKNYTRHDYKCVQKYGYVRFKGVTQEFYCKEIKEILREV